MHRFFVPPFSIKDNRVIFPVDISHQICRVLRLQPGQRVIVFDDSGQELEVEIAKLDPHAVEADICLRKDRLSVTSVQLHLYIGSTHRDKFEWILQKCCEAGASSFTPFISSRTLVQDIQNIQSKYPRWQKILQEASEQCGRVAIPQLLEPVRWNRVLETTQNNQCAIMAWEREQSTSLHVTLKSKPQQVAAVVGPEGGFSSDEVNQALNAGFQLITLGPRTLRMETAAVVLTSQVMYELEVF